MNMYKITIEKIEEVEKTFKEYEKISDTGNPKDDGAIYDYVPFIKTVEQKTEVYNQVVDDLNLVSVINAVNN